MYTLSARMMLLRSSACRIGYFGNRSAFLDAPVSAPSHVLLLFLRSPILDLFDSSDETSSCVFKSIVSAVDDANAAPPPAKRQKLSHEDIPVALWWDLKPLQYGLTSSFEELLATIIHETGLPPWTSLQDTFDTACVALSRRSGRRISFLVLENAQLLSADLSAHGRWMLLQQNIASGLCATKFICLHASSTVPHGFPSDASSTTSTPIPD